MFVSFFFRCKEEESKCEGKGMNDRSHFNDFEWCSKFIVCSYFM